MWISLYFGTTEGEWHITYDLPFWLTSALQERVDLLHYFKPCTPRTNRTWMKPVLWVEKATLENLENWPRHSRRRLDGLCCYGWVGGTSGTLCAGWEYHFVQCQCLFGTAWVFPTMFVALPNRVFNQSYNGRWYFHTRYFCHECCGRHSSCKAIH